MFVCTVRRGGLRRLAVAAVCGVVLAGAAFAANAVHSKAVAAAAQGGAMTQEIVSVEDVTSFFQGFGLTVDPTSAEVSTVTVPRKWDENFKAFNEVIKESGLDLTRVKNKKVDKWVVLLPDKTTADQKSYGVVLVYKNEPKGAYILQKPSGEVISVKQAAKETSLALTDEEIAANAGFGEEAAPAEGEAAPAQAEADPAEGEAAPAQAEAAPVEGETTPAATDAGDVPAQADAPLDIAIDPDGFPTD